MPITGSQKALMYCQSGVERCGATRSNYHSPKVFVAIAGVHYATARAVPGQQVDEGTLSITEVDGETPNTASFAVRGFTPQDGQDVVVTLGSKNNLDRHFAGTVLTDTSAYVGIPTNQHDQVNVIDYTWQLTRETITQRWTNVSATVIAQAIIAHAGRGFTSLRVEAGLPTIDEFTVTNQTHAAALGNLAQRIGARWKATYFKDVKFRITADPNETDPTTLTAASAQLTGMTAFSVRRDLSPVITRQPVEGGGGNAMASVAPGETSIPVSDGAWYNAAGGTVVSGPRRITYTGLGRRFITSSTEWKTQTGPTAARDWAGVVWAPALNLFVAVASGTTPQDVMTSPDGITWTTRTPAASSTWRAIAWAPALTLFAAVSTGGLVMTSPDGITWTSRTAAEPNTWQSIVWSPERGLFVAVAATGTNRVMTSPDGITWTARAAAAALAWQGVTWAPSLGLFAAIATTGPNPIMTSPDGITWTQRTAATVAWAIAWSPAVSRFVTVGSGNAMSSPDGITWTNRTPVNVGNQWNTVTWAPEPALFVALSFDAAGGTQRVMTSTDGITWVGQAASGVGIWYGVTWAPALDRFVAVGITTGTIQIMTNTIDAQPTLVGIPLSGAGAVLYTIKQGDPVNLRVVVNDVAAQATLAALMGGSDDGIIEGPVIQDGRISETEARARGQATIDLRKAIDVGISYTTKDINTHASRTIGVNLAAPTSVVASFKLRQVTISNFQPALWPTRQASASSVRVTLEDLLRLARAASAGR